MAEQLLICPSCKSEIPLTDVLTSQIAEKLRAEIESETKIKEKNLNDREKALLKKEGSIEKTIDEKLRAERSKLKKELLNEVESKYSLELDDLKEKLKEQKTANEKLKDAELKARKTERQLKEFEENFERNLEMQLKKSEGQIKNRIISEYETKRQKEIKEIESGKLTLDKEVSSLKGDLKKEKQKAQESSDEFDRLMEEKLKEVKREIKKKYDFQKEKEIAEVETNIKSLSEELRKEKSKGKIMELEYLKKKDDLEDNLKRDGKGFYSPER